MKNWFHIEGLTSSGIKTLEDRTHGLSYVKDYLSNHIQTPIKLLDLGCAEGLISDWLLENNTIENIVGIDANQDSIVLADKVFSTKENYHFSCQDLNNYSAISEINKQYDVVLLLAILQKLSNPLEFLDYVASSTSPLLIAIRIPTKWINVNYSGMNKVLDSNGYKLHNQVKGNHENQGVLYVYIKKRMSTDNNKFLNTSYKKEITKTNDLKGADSALISFPKAGRTWLRYLFASYVKNIFPDACFDLEFIPNVSWNQQRHDTNFPRVFFTHNYLDYYQHYKTSDFVVQQEYLNEKPVVFLHRHPLDVMVSYYHQITKRENIAINSIDNFINSDLYGIERHCLFMNNMLDYLRTHDNVHYVSYEKLKQDTFSEISKIFEFWNYEFDQNKLQDAVDQSRFDKMQQAEKSKTIVRLSESIQKENHQALKVRKGKTLAYREEMSEKLADKLESMKVVVELIDRLKKLQ